VNLKPRTVSGRSRPSSQPGLQFEFLECRRLLAVGDFIRQLDDASPNQQIGSEFGFSSSIDGNLAVVGSPGDDTHGFINSGQVHLYNASLGTRISTLANPTPAAGDAFGRSVSISGDILVVGSYLDDAGAPDSGVVHIFSATTGNLLRTIPNPTPAAFDYFGSSVAIAGDRIVVGAFLDDTYATDGGVAHVFSATTGALERTLNRPSAADFDYFGAAVAISGDSIVIGASRGDVGALDAGSALVFDAVTGALVQSFTNPTPANFDYFGHAVAVSGDTVVVGTYRDDTGTTNSGAAYTYSISSGNLLHTYVNPSPGAGDNFGFAVGIHGNTLVIGAYRDDLGGADSGLAYQFNASDGSLVQTLNNPTPASGDFYGASIAVGTNFFISTAYFDDTLALDAGTAYIYTSDNGQLTHSIGSPVPSAGNYYGHAVATSGPWLASGAYLEDFDFLDSGVVHIHNGESGTFVRTLSNPTPAPYDNFGFSLAMSTNLLVVGAPRDDAGAADSGVVHLFDAITGTLIRTIVNPTPGVSDFFGFSVAIVGDMVAVGAYRDDTLATDAGTVYLFDGPTGTLLSTLNNPTPTPSDGFGFAISMSPDHLLIGTPYDDTGAVDAGAAYVFSLDTNELSQTILNPEPASGDSFGQAVALYQQSAVIGAPRDSINGIRSGAAYVYAVNSGALQHMLLDPFPVDENSFGVSVALNYQVVAVGANRSDRFAIDSGSVDLFQLSSGEYLRELEAPGIANGDNYGLSVSVGHDLIAVGAPQHDGLTTDRGTTYVFAAFNNTQPFAISGGPYVGMEGVPLTFDGSGTSDGEDLQSMLTFEWDLDYDGALFQVDLTGMTPTVSFPDEFASRTMAMRVTDTRGLQSIATTTLEILNVAPQLTLSQASVSIEEGGTASNSGTFADVAADTVQITASRGAITDQGNGSWNWSFNATDGPDDSGDVTITATDNDGASTSLTFPLTVMNVAPQVTASSSSISTLSGDIATNTGTFSDVGNDTVTLSASLGNVSDAGNGSWSWTHTASPSDPATVTITAVDSDGATSAVEFAFTVLRIKADNPAVSAVEGQIVQNSGRYRLENATTVALSASSGTIVDNLDGTWSWSWSTIDGPDDSNTVIVTATFDGTTDFTHEFAANVLNAPPILAANAPNVTTFEGSPATHSGTFSDPGVDTVVLTASIGDVVDQGNGTWTWSYTPLDGPDHSQVVTITATDSDGAVSQTTFDLTVENSAPMVTASQPSVTVADGGTATNSGTYADPGQDTVTVTASVGTVQTLLDGTWTWEYTTENGPDDSQEVTITATDSDGAATTTTFALVDQELAQIQQFIVADGTAQRSLVRQVAVRFDMLVDIDPGAFAVTKLGVGGGNVDVTFTTAASGTQTVATILFSGPFVELGSGSLLDGEYQLLVDGALIRRAGSPELLDADGDGLAGGTRLFGAQAADAFYRLFGDVDGDRDVDYSDRSVFLPALGSTLGSPEYDARFDFDGDGDVDATDRSWFRRNFRQFQILRLLTQAANSAAGRPPSEFD
jgi:FG-GAP repeat